MKYHHLTPKKSILLEKKKSVELYYDSKQCLFVSFFPSILSLIFLPECKAALPKKCKAVFVIPSAFILRFLIQKHIEKQKQFRCFFLLKGKIVDQRKYRGKENKITATSFFAKVDVTQVYDEINNLFYGELAMRDALMLSNKNKFCTS